MTGITVSINGQVSVNPPTFLLIGNHNGGFPTNYAWTRNGQTIHANDSFYVVIGYTGVAHVYGSLRVLGNLPGVYQCYASNRATLTAVMGTVNIEGLCS